MMESFNNQQINIDINSHGIHKANSSTNVKSEINIDDIIENEYNLKQENIVQDTAINQDRFNKKLNILKNYENSQTLHTDYDLNKESNNLSTKEERKMPILVGSPNSCINFYISTNSAEDSGNKTNSMSSPASRWSENNFHKAKHKSYNDSDRSKGLNSLKLLYENYNDTGSSSDSSSSSSSSSSSRSRNQRRQGRSRSKSKSQNTSSSESNDSSQSNSSSRSSSPEEIPKVADENKVISNEECSKSRTNFPVEDKFQTVSSCHQPNIPKSTSFSENMPSGMLEVVPHNEIAHRNKDCFDENNSLNSNKLPQSRLPELQMEQSRTTENTLQLTNEETNENCFPVDPIDTSPEYNVKDNEAIQMEDMNYISSEMNAEAKEDMENTVRLSPPPQMNDMERSDDNAYETQSYNSELLTDSSKENIVLDKNSFPTNRKFSHKSDSEKIIEPENQTSPKCNGQIYSESFKSTNDETEKQEKLPVIHNSPQEISNNTVIQSNNAVHEVLDQFAKVAEDTNVASHSIPYDENANDANPSITEPYNFSCTENIFNNTNIDHNSNSNSSLESRSSADKLVIDHPSIDRADLGDTLCSTEEKEFSKPIKPFLKRKLSESLENESSDSIFQPPSTKLFHMDNLQKSNEAAINSDTLNNVTSISEVGIRGEESPSNAPTSDIKMVERQKIMHPGCPNPQNKNKKNSASQEARPTLPSISISKKKQNSKRNLKPSTKTPVKHNNQVSAQIPPAPNVSTSQSLESTNVLNPTQLESQAKRKLYKCTSCISYYDKWNLFLHMREKHNRHICLYCLHFFRTTEKLSLHLEMTHDMDQRHYNSEQMLRESRDEISESKVNMKYSRLLMCCTCSHIFDENENFSDHNCNEYIEACVLCGQKGRHNKNCEADPSVQKKAAKVKMKQEVIHTAKNKLEQQSINRNKNMTPFPNVAPNVPNCNLPTETQIVSKQLKDDVTTPNICDVATSKSNVIHGEQGNNNAYDMKTELCSISNVIDTTVQSTTNQIEQLPVLPLSTASPNEINYETFKEESETTLLLTQNTPNESLLPNLSKQEDTINANNIELSSNTLIFPKFKLRVPKEFQKSVESSFSSSDTDETNSDAGEIRTTQTNNEQGVSYTSPKYDNFDNSATESATEVANSQDDPDSNNSESNDDENGNIDEACREATQTNIARILKEIEQTKLDIQRTKETIHQNNQQKQQRQQNMLAEEQNTTTSDGQSTTKNWSPTPPASPKTSSWLTLRKHDEEQGDNDNDLVRTPVLPIPPRPPEERKCSEGSDMDIDETITGGQQHIPNSDNEKFLRESPTAIENNDKESALDVKNISELNASKHEVNETNDTKVEDLNTSNEEIDVCGQLGSTHTHPSHEIDGKIGISDPDDGIDLANEDSQVIDLCLEKDLIDYDSIELIRRFLKNAYPFCLYCNHARRIAVNIESLIRHMLANHRFRILLKKEQLNEEKEIDADITIKTLKGILKELSSEYMNGHSYCTVEDGKYSQHYNERIYECFQCRFVATTHKELYLHNRRMHLRTAILCHMCRANFYSFSEILCHICPGAPNKISIFNVNFRCCLCNLDKIPSPFRLMVHLRMKHFACDVCLEDCRDQSRLSSHVWKHKLSHLCYRCGIAYRNKMDITKHLFWKHGTESTSCKRCLQKRWRHVYHFCIPPSVFTCDVCDLCFSKAMYLRVHQRIHTGDFRYPCTEENCEEKFISRKLLIKHIAAHQMPLQLPTLPIRRSSQNETPNISNMEENSTDIKDVAQNDNVKKEEIVLEKESIAPIEEKSECPILDSNNEEIKKREEKSELETSRQDQNGDNKKALEDTPRKKRKQSKRDKGLLDDLNLMAPNLSESDSSDENESCSSSDEEVAVKRSLAASRTGTNSLKSDDETNDNGLQEPKEDDGKVLEIWKNFLEAQKAGGNQIETTDYTEDNYPCPSNLHVAISDHDYCKMYKPEVRKTKKQPKRRLSSPRDSIERKELNEQPCKSPVGSVSSSPSRSPILPSSPAQEAPLPIPQMVPEQITTRTASPKPDVQSSSESSSDSSCSCSDSNCSCSSSESDSSSSSSSTDSDSSACSDHSPFAKRQRKRSGKSESISPTKILNRSSEGGKLDNNAESNTDIKLNEKILVENQSDQVENVQSKSSPKGPVFYESDLETAESETDEEFYDEHPQKLANELFAQKRAQLLGQTRLSPSHNFDIVENSRPSTPSLPEEFSYGEKRSKLKKKKRDRKSQSRGNYAFHKPEDSACLVTETSPNKAESFSVGDSTYHQVNNQFQVKSHTEGVVPNTETKVFANDLAEQSYAIPPIPYPTPSLLAAAAAAVHAGSVLNANSFIGQGPLNTRVSEGSSSDVDNSLKRSKRARRPNKFYGYTSDDENMSSAVAQPLYIGSRAVKPEPPPQLTWRKEDLPTPSKSILNPKNKVKTPKTPNNSSTNTALDSSEWSLSKSAKRKRSNDPQNLKKRSSKKKDSNLPPIPTLKIPLSQIGLNISKGKKNKINEKAPSTVGSTSDSSSEDEGVPQHIPTNLHSYDSSKTPGGSSWGKGMGPGSSSMADLNQTNFANTIPNNLTTSTSQLLNQLLPPPPPPVPTPETTVFNQRIPPALLPNPDFATLQYFKANNIRYPIRPPAGARQARDGESVYCYCRSPYDEVSEMIACDGDNCLIEWFHFECVGIILAPQGKWFCAECRPKHAGDLYPEGVGNFNK